ncbi:sigma-54-dependent Fis family transcriptional regulator [Curvibacter sp. HBC28]|uniref:Sigma-54-dependent Fis family transcriptional regulator n=1 Tax=Curvibacter microcysteis TaxID=3026419 RepID=A0ABT5MAC9_9BURK|nr:sigma-54-dependent Fis family transcriptional regulator [Curvibacter sp. HBC28]MDD0813545.1 sigma-54-dependent Fis family transcriptional regulator [Curvibacter sp. HBC28]
MANLHPVPAPLLREARLRLLSGDDLSLGRVDERVARSWRRSLAAGLAPSHNSRHAEHLSGGELRQALACNRDLINHSQPVMEYLFEQVRHSHSMVVLADRHGTLMHTLGDADFLGKAERVALQAGANWHEAQRGTNAIGTALAESCGIEIHGPEHYLERNDFLTCAASPIASATGELLGILDISGDQRSHHPHTLGLVNTAARMIENRLFTTSCQQQTRLHLHPQAHGIGTLAEGIVALSEDGWIMGANRQALKLLGLQREDIGATPLARVLDTRFEALLLRAHQQPQQPLCLHRRDGSPIHAQLYNPPGRSPARPLTLRAHPAPHEGRSAPSTPSEVQDALQQLDTGDHAWRAAADKARRVAGKPIPVLLLGESGVGKELFARALHDSSPRRHRPFVAINCAALPEQLIEAELFGYSAGAFTGARKEGRPGRLREADGGTLFLDEIGDMPLALQTRLLRVLQERQVSPLGGGEAVAVDFALVCATHQPLREAAEAGRFRADLYYRLNGLSLQLPPLRARSDFAALTDKLLLELSGEPRLHLAPELQARLAAYDWPGNLRQYASVLRTAIAMLDPDEHCIDWPHLGDDLRELLQRAAAPWAGGSDSAATTPPAAAVGTPPSGEQKLADISRAAIQQAIQQHQGNLSAAARQLGISRQTLYRRMGA